MNAWCLPLNAVGGELIYIPLSGAAKRGGSLLFGASWSIDAGDGIDDKCIFVTDQGEVLVFTGTDPTSSTNWRQEGRYDISQAARQERASAAGRRRSGRHGRRHRAAVGGDAEGRVGAVAGGDHLQHRADVDARVQTKDAYPWTIAKWDEGDAMFVNFPGGQPTLAPRPRRSASATCTPGRGRVTSAGTPCASCGCAAACSSARRTARSCRSKAAARRHALGRDRQLVNGNAYVCTMVGGWEMFQVPPNQVTWMQARAAFFSAAREPFEPQLAATTDYEFRIPPPPQPGPRSRLARRVGPGAVGANATSTRRHGRQRGLRAVGSARCRIPPVRNTMWVSIGETGFQPRADRASQRRAAGQARRRA